MASTNTFAALFNSPTQETFPVSNEPAAAEPSTIAATTPTVPEAEMADFSTVPTKARLSPEQKAFNAAKKQQEKDAILKSGKAKQLDTPEEHTQRENRAKRQAKKQEMDAKTQADHEAFLVREAKRAEKAAKREANHQAWLTRQAEYHERVAAREARKAAKEQKVADDAKLYDRMTKASLEDYVKPSRKQK